MPVLALALAHLCAPRLHPIRSLRVDAEPEAGGLGIGGGVGRARTPRPTPSGAGWELLVLELTPCPGQALLCLRVSECMSVNACVSPLHRPLPRRSLCKALGCWLVLVLP